MTDENWDSFIKGVKPISRRRIVHRGAVVPVRRDALLVVQRSDVPYTDIMDLHGYTTDQAYEALHGFVRHWQGTKVKVHVITGRGRGVLFRLVPLWLGIWGIVPQAVVNRDGQQLYTFKFIA